MTASLSTVLPRSDFLRAPLLATARPEGYKEWHHVIVQGDGLRLLINFSLTGEACSGGTTRLVPRVIVAAHDGGWHGVLERYVPAALDVSADLGTVAVGGTSLAVRTDGYRIELALPERGVTGRLDLTAACPPTVVPVNNKPLGCGRLSWIYVPRLRADGWLQLGSATYRLTAAPAYHDHNWGRFHWGDDFGWMWGSVLPTSAAAPWSFVLLRMTDRRRLRTLAQALYVWHHDEQVGAFRDATLRIATTGALGIPADLTLPAPMRLLLGDADGVPATITVTGERGGDHVQLIFRPESYARIAHPSETCLDRSVVLAETAGWATVAGVLDGKPIDLTAQGIVELMHG